jgi:hypothetical protein
MRLTNPANYLFLSAVQSRFGISLLFFVPSVLDDVCLAFATLFLHFVSL